MDDITKQKMQELSGLWNLTGRDWVLKISHDLTEPTCPTAVIHPVGKPSIRYRADCDTIEEAIAESVERCHREWVRGEKFDGFEFWSENDCPIERLLAERKPLDRTVDPG